MFPYLLSNNPPRGTCVPFIQDLNMSLELDVKGARPSTAEIGAFVLTDLDMVAVYIIPRKL